MATYAATGGPQSRCDASWGREYGDVEQGVWRVAAPRLAAILAKSVYSLRQRGGRLEMWQSCKSKHLRTRTYVERLAMAAGDVDGSRLRFAASTFATSLRRVHLCRIHSHDKAQVLLVRQAAEIRRDDL